MVGRLIDCSLLQGDLDAVAALLSSFRAQKVVMAPAKGAEDVAEAEAEEEAPVEPAHVKRLLAALAPFLRGASFCGAGGGGCLALITKRPYRELLPELQKVARAL